ncbi:MAG TPA: ribonuclease HII [Syntrophorhabdales bacterium]|nr:ribonuclease HII [Syntrophorhabdales bacterium]
MNCLLTGIVAGLDEAGRGPLAGPVISSCVAWQGLPAARAPVNDSKLLSEQQRKSLFPWIVTNAYRVGVGLATPREIEELNIHNATLLSMERALEAVRTPVDLILVDGLFAVPSYPNCKTLVKGDRKCFFIACASIVAKVVRDDIMERYNDLYPQYLFKKNKGYPTEEHKEAIRIHGLSPIHRRTFRGVKEMVDAEMDEGRLL